MRHRTTDTAKGHRNYIIIACDVLLFLAMLKWLPVEPEVARGLAVLTFIGILWLTEALHVTVTALLVPVLAMFMGILPGAKALAGFADPTIFLFFGGFALAGALHEQKIDTWLAGKILRMARGSLGMALILIFLATAFLSMWMSNTATAAMMLPLVIGLLDRIPAEKLKTTAPFAVLGVAYSASIGGMGTLVGSPPNAIAAHELGMGFAEWFRIAMPIVLVFGVIVFCLMYLFFRPRLGLHVDMAPAEGEDAEARLNARQVRVLLLFVLVAGSWMCSSFLSSALGGIPSMDTLIALCAAVLLPLCGVINWGGIAKNTDWGVLLLFGGGITLSSILVQTGAAEFLADTANGDARAALNAVELGILTTERGPDGKIHIDLAVAQECIQRRAVKYDKTGDNHYDTISAFIKSMRGTDPDAAVYYLAKMLDAGEDIKFIARRIMICASEAVGNADPQAIQVAVSAACVPNSDASSHARHWQWNGLVCRRRGLSCRRQLPMWRARRRATRRMWRSMRHRRRSG